MSDRRTSDEECCAKGRRCLDHIEADGLTRARPDRADALLEDGRVSPADDSGLAPEDA